MSKYYFYDLGIRNALILNFNPMHTRDDLGKLWENFIIIERIMRNSYQKKHVNYYFWRTYKQKEIDLIEEYDGQLHGIEFKSKDGDVIPPSDWVKTYTSASFTTITPQNYLDFIT